MSELDILYERRKRARERGDHAAVLILEGRINALTRALIARANELDARENALKLQH